MEIALRFLSISVLPLRVMIAKEKKKRSTRKRTPTEFSRGISARENARTEHAKPRWIPGLRVHHQHALNSSSIFAAQMGFVESKTPGYLSLFPCRTLLVLRVREIPTKSKQNWFQRARRIHASWRIYTVDRDSDLRRQIIGEVRQMEVKVDSIIAKWNKSMKGKLSWLHHTE